ncbi:hypothetical protein [Pedobacter sp. MR22-3]|uniref:hypothetical protein n=1 Tax=Pedobacter sp. MR22-3 TaxID=2994552 RepID=UPI002247BDD9|nr:hypothetical protein [Pedobacter sp. MR22-3]MCX2583181.1 hypothetical protein [Pedobacter sp. MR22-3]
MKKILTLLATLIVILGVGSCKKGAHASLNKIEYGSSFGMCWGYCVRIMAITSNQVSLEKKKNSDQSDVKRCQKSLSNEELSSIKSLIKSEFFELPDVIDCPDCADGGAEWVTIIENGKSKKVTFDYGKAPAAIKELVDKLRETEASITDCN